MLFPDWNSQYTTEHDSLLQYIVICCNNYFIVIADSAVSNDRNIGAAYIVMMKWLCRVTRTSRQELYDTRYDTHIIMSVHGVHPDE